MLPSTDNMQVLGFCIGEYPNRIITDLDCNIHKCTQMAESDSVGKILDGGQIELNKAKDTRWTGKDPLCFVECRTCAFLPLCMGGCNPMENPERRGPVLFGLEAGYTNISGGSSAQSEKPIFRRRGLTMIYTRCTLKPGKDGAICVESNAQTYQSRNPRAQVELRAAVDRNPVATTSLRPCAT